MRKKNKNIIYVPFAYQEGMQSGVNLPESADKTKIYLKNACVALISAKHYNPECCVALVTNIEKKNISSEFVHVLENAGIQIITIPFDEFRFGNDYRWGMAFYKLTALSHIVDMQYDNICYMDTDVFVQKSFTDLWDECEGRILLLHINEGYGSVAYRMFSEETEGYSEVQSNRNSKNVTHYGGEFFAGPIGLAREFCRRSKTVYENMINNNIRVNSGDEFIVSIVASNMREFVKNAGAYVFRFWTDPRYYLVSTSFCLGTDSLLVLHLPSEKGRGMIKMYDRYICKGMVPSNRTAWKMFRLSRQPLIDMAKSFAIRVLNC